MIDMLLLFRKKTTVIARSMLPVICLLMLISVNPLYARTVASSELTLLGRGWSSSENYPVTFGRIPTRLIGNFNEHAVGQSRCSSGMAFHFSTNSRNIGANYTLWANISMPHQAATGTRGLDLYIYDTMKESWVYLSTHKPATTVSQMANFGLNLDGSFHDFMIYLPLYDGVKDFSLVVDDNAQVKAGNTAYCDPSKRILIYGTSITQGACASRPGMAGTSLLGRKLKSHVFNFGFSSGGRIELTAAEALSEIKDISVYVIDVVPNASAPLLYSNLYDFVSILLKANPGASFIFVEALDAAYAAYNEENWSREPDNRRLRLEVDRLRADYPTRKFELVSASEFSDPESEGTVDGIHYTDLGFMLWTRALTPVVRKLLDKTSGVGSAETDCEVYPVAYYDLQGRLLAAPAEGLNIELMSDGSVRKSVQTQK